MPDNTTPALHIEPFSEADLDLLRRLNTEEMKEHLGGLETDEQLRSRHRRYLNFAPGQGCMFRIVLPGSGGEAAGTVGYGERTWQGRARGGAAEAPVPACVSFGGQPGFQRHLPKGGVHAGRGMRLRVSGGALHAQQRLGAGPDRPRVIHRSVTLSADKTENGTEEWILKWVGRMGPMGQDWRRGSWGR
jgi:hypothetical protein